MLVQVLSPLQTYTRTLIFTHTHTHAHIHIDTECSQLVHGERVFAPFSPNLMHFHPLPLVYLRDAYSYLVERVPELLLPQSMQLVVVVDGKALDSEFWCVLVTHG